MNILSLPDLASHSQGIISPSISWQRWDMTHPVHPNFASWALEHHLHLNGTEGLPAVHFLYSLKNIGGGRQSGLYHLWNQRKAEYNSLCQKTIVWTLHDNKTSTPIGVAVWECFTALPNLDQPSDENFVAVNIYVDPQWRGRGLMSELFFEMQSPIEDLIGEHGHIKAGGQTEYFVKKHFPHTCHDLIIFEKEFAPYYIKNKVRF